MNLIWPNLFETSPHVINAVMGAIEGMRCCLGPTKVLQYTLQGLFHPARRVRDVYWKVYNNMYLGAADGLVAAYPTLVGNLNTDASDPQAMQANEEEVKRYRRHELDLCM